VTLPVDATALDAMAAMSEHNIHHLPVMDGPDPAGVVTSTDLARVRQGDPVYLVQAIARQSTPAAIASLVADVPHVVRQLARSGVAAERVNRLLAAVQDRVTLRLLELAQRELGPPPAPWAWLAFGSQARRDTALGGDQDNGMIIADSLRQGDDTWFAAIADRVCTGLAQAGYPRCRGGIMASNPKWRMTLSQWRETVSEWVRTPTDSAAMHVSIFFDLRAVAGGAGLADALQRHMLECAAANSIFLAALARNAVSAGPPLGFFRRFVLEHSGEHRDTLDLKRRGILPVVDLVRLQALAAGVDAVGTAGRLAALGESGHMAPRNAANLRDAYYTLLQARLAHHCAQIEAGATIDNHLAPDTLTELHRERLRDAFSVIHRSQELVLSTRAGGIR